MITLAAPMHQEATLLRQPDSPLPLATFESAPSAVDAVAALNGVTAYINAGGRGTRLNPVFTPDPAIGISKAMLPVGEPPMPLIDHHVNKLLHAGMPNILVGAGDHVNVARYTDERYRGIGKVVALYSEVQLGNGGDLVTAVRELPELFADDVAITNVDTLLDLSEAAMLDVHRRRGADLTVAVTTLPGVPNEGAYHLGADGRVLHCQEASPAPIPDELAEAVRLRASSTGAVIIRKAALQVHPWRPEDGPLSLYRDIVGDILAQGRAYAYNNGTRLFTDVGTPDSWAAAHANPAELEQFLHRS